jgi:two-component system LytT family response regulator
MDSEKISAVIIDDEPDAIKLLELYLRHYPIIKIVGTETNASKGFELVKNTLAKLVFLDIDMPDINGLQIASKIHSGNFPSEIVFTTAHQHYAYEAMGVEPLDFLTKPFCIEDLDLVMQKYKAKDEKKKLEMKSDKFDFSQTNSTRIKLPANFGVVMIDVKDIAILKSQANKCLIYLQDGTTETINKNLKVLIKKLNSSAFFKLSRSVYINLNYVTSIDKRNSTCFLSFNQTIFKEYINALQIKRFEELKIFPAFQTQ